MKRFYLVDAENVASAGLHGYELLGDDSQVIVFYSKQISLPDGTFVFSRIKVGGKNALDFQIVARLGLLIGKHPEAQFIILSKDKGYKSAIAELLSINPMYRINLHASIYASFTDAEKKQFDAMPNTSHSMNREAEQNVVIISETIKNSSGLKFVLNTALTNNQIPISNIKCKDAQMSKQLIDCLNNSKSKCELHTALLKCFHQEGIAIYRVIKQYL